MKSGPPLEFNIIIENVVLKVECLKMRNDPFGKTKYQQRFSQGSKLRVEVLK